MKKNPYQKIQDLKNLQAQIKGCKDPRKAIDLQNKLISLTLDVLRDPEVKKLMALKNDNKTV